MENDKPIKTDKALRQVRKGDTAWRRCASGVFAFSVVGISGFIATIERDGWKGDVHIKQLHLRMADAQNDATPKQDDGEPVIKEPVVAVEPPEVPAKGSDLAKAMQVV